MIRTVDCDQVFDTLTRGPFPSGDPADEQVELHLRCCHECRRLAEALRPAVKLIHESLGSSANNLPGYQGAIPAAKTPWLGELPAPVGPLDRTTEVGILTRVGRFVPPWTGGVVALAVIGVLLSCLPRADYGGTEPRVTANGELPALVEGRLDQRLASAGVPAVCIRRVSVRDMGGADIGSSAERAVCCTQCHGKSEAQVAPIKSIPSFLAACVACHRGSERW